MLLVIALRLDLRMSGWHDAAQLEHFLTHLGVGASAMLFRCAVCGTHLAYVDASWLSTRQGNRENRADRPREYPRPTPFHCTGVHRQGRSGQGTREGLSSDLGGSAITRHSTPSHPDGHAD
jgi:hypothetical protein